MLLRLDDMALIAMARVLNQLGPRWHPGINLDLFAEAPPNRSAYELFDSVHERCRVTWLQWQMFLRTFVPDRHPAGTYQVQQRRSPQAMEQRISYHMRTMGLTRRQAKAFIRDPAYLERRA